MYVSCFTFSPDNQICHFAAICYIGTWSAILLHCQPYMISYLGFLDNYTCHVILLFAIIQYNTIHSQLYCFVEMKLWHRKKIICDLSAIPWTVTCAFCTGCLLSQRSGAGFPLLVQSPVSLCCQSLAAAHTSLWQNRHQKVGNNNKSNLINLQRWCPRGVFRKIFYFTNISWGRRHKTSQV